MSERAETTGAPTARYTSFNSAPALDAGGDIVLRPVAGQRLMVSEVTVPADRSAPVHTHEQEKIGFVVSGSCEFQLDGAERHLGPGDIYQVPAGVPHGLRTTDTECVLVDVFSPPRPDLLERMS